MEFFSRLFRRAPRAPVRPETEECVLVHLDGISLPDEVYERCDVMTLSGQLSEVLQQQRLGQYDGDERGPEETTLFMYGPDAERLFNGIEPVLRASPLCQNARVVIRRGAPGATEREIRLPVI